MNISFINLLLVKESLHQAFQVNLFLINFDDSYTRLSWHVKVQLELLSFIFIQTQHFFSYSHNKS